MNGIMEKIKQRLVISAFAIFSTGLGCKGLLTGQITIYGKRFESDEITGHACLVTSIGLLLLGAGLALRILTDSDEEFRKLFTIKSVLLWTGVLLFLFGFFL